MTTPLVTVAVLGTGTMGSPIARNLLHAGFPVRVWNRTPAKAAAVGVDARRTSTPGEAAVGADVLITMLADGAAVEQVMTGPTGALSMLGAGAIWIQMSTVGTEWTDRLAGLAARYDVAFVDAPVSGSSGAAQTGELIILASGATTARARVQPLFEVLGRQRCGYQALGMAAGSSSRSITGWRCSSKEWSKPLRLAKHSASIHASFLRPLATGQWRRTTHWQKAPRWSTRISRPASRCDTRPRTPSSHSAPLTGTV
ncbi:MAG: 3-hydroxyisobutyrate dehydrogenase [Mycobacterium sp.]|nr:3-hydroxyisobutyrate dehydrogenase [Mycobacterium sp.]